MLFQQDLEVVCHANLPRVVTALALGYVLGSLRQGNISGLAAGDVVVAGNLEMLGYGNTKTNVDAEV